MTWAVQLEPGNTGNVPYIGIPSAGNLTIVGDLQMTQRGSGILLPSPSGRTFWRLMVSDTPALARQSISPGLLVPIGQWVVQPEPINPGAWWSVIQNNSQLYPILNGDLVLTSSGTGVIVITPGGFGPYRILVNNDGAPSIQSSPTPQGSYIWNQDFVIARVGAGVVCTTPNGLHSYRIGVDDSGAIFGQQVS